MTMPTSGRRSKVGAAALSLAALLLLLTALASRAAAPSGAALHVVRFSEPLQDAWLAAVAATGADPVHYVAPDGYLVWADGEALAGLQALAAAETFLRYDGPYKPPVTAAASQAPGAGAETVTVTIQMLRHDGRAATEARIAALAVELLSSWQPVMAFQNATAVVRQRDLPAIAALPDIVAIELFEPPQRFDEVQAQTLAGNLTADRKGPLGPGYLAWLAQRGFPSTPEAYPIVDIVDDGFGNGLAAQAGGDITMRKNGQPGGASRMAYISNCSSAADGRGDDGHGHLNTSIAGGFDTRAGAAFRDERGYQYGLGINPYGRFASTRVFDGDDFDRSRCEQSYAGLVRHSYQAGARILSNSWGCASCAGTYNLASQAYDAAARDADPLMPGDQPLLLIFSAGNSGPAPRTIGSPADGKNVLTVGAVENQRPSWTDYCGYGGAAADSAQDIANYSSRGPASGGRVKPDLVAPGTHVTGTASTSPFYTGLGVCSPYYPEGQVVFAASTGTSHAAPAVAGAASLATWWLQNKTAVTNPSPALLKAFLIAGSAYVSGAGAKDDLPSHSQGFGMPDLDSAFGDTPWLTLDQHPDRTFDQSGLTWSQEIQAARAGEPVRIVMVYTDQPGLVARDGLPLQPQVNDLDLIVRVGDATYYGNDLAGAWSVSGGQPDRLNNVEAVFLPSAPAAAISITVAGFNIAGDGVPNSGDSTDQDFALACLNCRAGMPAPQTLIYFPLVGGFYGS